MIHNRMVPQSGAERRCLSRGPGLGVWVAAFVALKLLLALHQLLASKSETR